VKRYGALLIAALLGVGLCGLGQDRALSVTEIDPGVRGVGLGGAGVASSVGVEALYYNAARLADSGSASFQSFYALHLGAANYMALGVTFPSWGLAFLNLSSSDIAGYDAGGNPTETLRYRSTAILAGFGASPRTLSFLPRLPFDWAIGTRLKFLSTAVADARGYGITFDASGFVGLNSLNVAGVTIDDLSIGFLVNNVIGSLRYDNTSDNLLTDARLGMSAVIAGQVLVAIDYEISGRFHLGAEYRPVPTFALRAGILQQNPGTSLTLGIGLDLEGFGIDYAFLGSTGLSGSHRVALSIDFASIDFGSLMSMLRRILP